MYNILEIDILFSTQKVTNIALISLRKIEVCAVKKERLACEDMSTISSAL